ncbi:O-antigen ligase family protein [uncultured Hyphomonas sp.]|jgi:exopolysaccharide production protein ExoQ|uniref:O-antigen ligase family protein n=1 Tax=uncultured Hyphomonas sp. TaxID=225298 RepID=UPI000C649296|nr:hypothetical protein [Hyphomonadaceae bacterium]MBA28480.1 hypothetical protein [Hyphomonadaceae bacterium]|tara:strand:+ start:289647 stop:290948 length:1302 start_codon:yes stop_codon:yes gene_type:complete
MNIVSRIPTDRDSSLVMAKVYEEPRKIPYWEQGLISLWFLNSFVPLPLETPLRYLMVLWFLWLFALHKEQVIPIMLKAWPLFLLPIFGLISVLWSPYMGAALRSGALYLLTPFVAVIIITRFDISTILRCMFFAGVMAIIVCVPFYDTMPYGGPYPQKNYFAQQMLFVALLSFMTLLNEKSWPWTRMLAALIFPIALIFMLRAPSATALVFAAVGIVGLFAVKFVWVAISKVRHLRTIIFILGASVILSGAMIVLNQTNQTYLTDFLGALGKDTTFTGRTHIWAAGNLAAQEHPIFGLGLEGFWNPANGAAQSINEMDFKPYGTKLTFHNAYLEVRVHLGYIGLGLYLLLWAWCGYRLFRQFFKESSLEMSALLVFGAIVFISTLTESFAWASFNTPLNLLYLGALATLSPIRRVFVSRVPVYLNSPAGYAKT